MASIHGGHGLPPNGGNPRHHLWKTDSSKQALAWAKGLVVCLFEAMRGQWIYQNTVMRDKELGIQACSRREELCARVDMLLALGEEGLRQQDWHLLEINHQSMEPT